MKDGYLEKCKSCHKEKIRKARERNHEYYLVYDRKRANQPKRVAARKEYAQTETGRIVTQKGKQSWSNNNPHKKRAHVQVKRALLSGELTKTPCVVCGSAKVEGHHDDYAKPLNVVWLCPKHHADLHKRQRNLPMDLPSLPKSNRWKTTSG